MAQDTCPPIRTERFIHRDSDGSLEVGLGMHEAAGLEHVYKEVESAIDKGLPPSLPNTLLYRGVAEHAGWMVRNAPVGEVITDQGFLSTTRINHADVFEELATLEDPVLLIIHVPEGTQALSLSDVDPDSEWAHELEVVVQRSTTLLIVNKIMEGGVAMVDVVIANQPNPRPPSSEGNPAADASEGLESAIARGRLTPLQIQVEWLDQGDD